MTRMKLTPNTQIDKPLKAVGNLRRSFKGIDLNEETETIEDALKVLEAALCRLRFQ